MSDSNGVFVLSRSLVDSPFISQVREIQQDRIVSPQKLVSWFLWLESRSEWATLQFEALAPVEKSEFRCVQRVFESISDRRFLVQTDPRNVFRPTLAETFQVLSDFVRVVAQDHIRGLLVVGSGGTGKSFTVLDTLQSEGFTQGKDFFRMTGYSTPLSLYNVLSKNPTGFFVFDDCDSVFTDPTAVNILKAVLDTLPTRTVSWQSTTNKVDVHSFDFSGRIIFISNLDPSRVQNESFQALTTRVLTLIVGGSPEEILNRCVELMPVVGQHLSLVERQEILDFMRENYSQLQNFSIRSLVKIVGLKAYSPTGWRRLARYMN